MELVEFIGLVELPGFIEIATAMRASQRQVALGASPPNPRLVGGRGQAWPLVFKSSRMHE